ncbi:hypothetical protein I8G32_04136 [Rhodopseudomonas palustris]|nr:hypothetical protein [Rhodopseudomonas palustris]OPF92583.1 hypothetical protein B1S06_15600 [Rhodopseudomonas palustris]QQM05566.1 hypothetical protein I8G32_04136 [Rhodopseudomonas palustris]RJF63316.1 hypothetical protein D4Q71_16100 [Rhodopseudomonas palustris]WAB76899.1 hypothetical protein OR798_20765 [Rhodopseudomonas palustris]WBU29179.1 hypothetical protein OOZ54_21315 [Rhodopseudomonas palustris]
MGVIIYPLHFIREFHRRLTVHFTRLHRRTSNPLGTDVCTCGQTITAPTGSSYSKGRAINAWHCNACDRRWNTFSELGFDKGKERSDVPKS